MRKIGLIILIIAFAFNSVFTQAVKADTSDTGVPLREKNLKNNDMPKVDYDVKVANLPFYEQVLKGYQKGSYKDTDGIDIVLRPDEAKSSNGGSLPIKNDIGGNAKPALVWDDSVKWFEWTFDVPEDGLYQLYMRYYPLKGKRSPIVRKLIVDGVVPFQEALNVSFERLWVDKGKPVRDSNGDDIRPLQEEKTMWNYEGFSDSKGFYPEPFRLYFSKGKHTIRLEYVSEPVAIDSIEVKSPENIPSYDEVLNQYKAMGYKEVKDAEVKFQAEFPVLKSDPTIRAESNSDPSVEPAANGDFILNVFGDWNWRRGNQWAEWKFNVPQDGLYKISFKVGQWWGDGLPSYRQVAIDGKVPFKELEEYPFKYQRDWRMETLSDKNGKPYLFYLTKGEHTLRLTDKVGPMSEVVNAMSDLALRLSKMIREIIMVTGARPDPNFEYELDKKVPGLMDEFKDMSKDIEAQMKYITNISGQRPSVYYSFKSIKKSIDEMIRNPDLISRRLNDLNNAQTSFGQWMLDLQNEPLVIDYFIVSSPDKSIPTGRSNFLQKVGATWYNFLKSFYKDYNSVGSSTTTGKKTIKVWVAMGREWAEILRDMADNEFTPKTGIKVQINTFPAGQLNAGAVNVILLAINSGKAPDVAIGVDSQSPVEFAIRGATADLSKFPDFKDVAKWFVNGAFIPFEYRGGIYAIPCTQDFNVLFYRKDILSELKLGIPQTWDDIYSELPILQQHGMEFYYPPVLDPFLFQYGGDYYTEDYMRSALDTSEAYMAFKEWTELYTNFKIPMAANFFNRFRTGEMPLGVGGYNEYVMFTVAAPELTGRWGIAPFPGHRMPDATINRRTGSFGTTNIILQQSKNKREAWEFLKWWMSEDVQSRFGENVEAIVGVGARWNSANVAAFKSMPWKQEDLNVILEQWKQFKVQPVVLGGYFTGRYVGFAWNNVVLGGMKIRDALEDAVKQINKEMKAKQEEFSVKP
ncbi:ABC-type glycerol-3-phosphate transport system, substrate-binding protein [Caldanaerobius fijiensis DSM 17918]|uniref:ABC-type glycerol-3-phosphate transport system, substrate-binding protein n=1 Tax=Caldanaerobius fijiensis DSM 17918 TaxID=1121256 RepID=A0A1M4WJR7_9THEO|nr:extracellular solute-binding protein [Caldanaerobius fijiensis]SHE81437.1 ABC-type glycerol-3-phosphate transport system, substrate-binding protein [Caldanaerobius fijiensis DSM 17918]